MADLVCTLTPRRWRQLPQRSHRANGLERKQGAADVFKLWLVFEFIVLPSPCWGKQAAAALAYLSLGVSLGVVVEEEGEG